ncbi:CPBP family intramembrane metalloprotease [Eikenella sp. S3360]|uniref:CPBP family intramembrane metalloprotease n=1 Tax=Eikenella glucosivorans TaxID=2766967 RepID=A0ABS0NC10_9NEIS|nr:CPBP family intramembrane metalloprotease [Eikenella glucosivorans]
MRDKVLAVLRLFGLLLVMMALPVLLGLFGYANAALGWRTAGGAAWYAAQGAEALLFGAAGGAVLYWFARLYRRGANGYFRPPGDKISGKKLLLSAGYLLLLLAVGPLYEALMRALGADGGVDDLQNQQILLHMVRQLPLPMVLHIVLLAPLLEELLLRGIFFQNFGAPDRPGKRLALLAASAFVFGSLHNPPTEPAFLLYSAMGLVLGGAYLHTKDLKYPVLIHMVNNTISLVSSFWPE